MSGYRPEGLSDDRAPTGAPETTAVPPSGRFGILGWLRWVWRQLTSMRVALILLMLLAVVALPGAFFPQRPRDAAAVARYVQDNPELAPVVDAVGLFDVYGSPWFSAVYLLLFASLIGCIVPRCWAHARALRAQPPAVPQRLSRFHHHETFGLRATPERVASRVQDRLGRRYRTRVVTTSTGTMEISAEKGWGRETGNLLFHLALVGLLVATAWGQLVYYRGQAVVIAQDSFANAAVDYDSFERGTWFDTSQQEPFRIRLDEFSSTFAANTRPDDFQADVTLFRGDGTESTETIRVNEPLAVGDATVYLTGNGYAPVFEVRDGDGELAFTGPVMFLPQDNVYTSTGVVLVPDANAGDPQLAFNGTLFPTAVVDQSGEIVASAFPQPLDPAIVLNAWTGQLGLDDGIPRNLFVLDTTDLDQITVTGDDGTAEPLQIVLFPGQTVELPDGQGSITYTELRRFAALDVRWDPSVPAMGVFAGLAFAGLTGSLFLPRRRLWVRVVPVEGGSVVHAAALARGDDPRLASALERALSTVRPAPRP